MTTTTSLPPHPFTPAELATLRTHGIALFAGRVIFEAQPPMPAHQMAQVEHRCAGPLPAELRALWEHTAGGRLDYDLTVPMLGRQEAISWVELFFMGSDGYQDLQGWIDHELELMADAAGGSVGGPIEPTLTHLPFGGFEYCDRVYIVVEPGPTYGHVVAWKEGLPPAWVDQLHEDAVGSVAPSLLEACAALHLDEDPLSPVSDFFAGQSLLEYLDERQRQGLEVELRDKLVDYYRRAVLDWATPLAAGTLLADPVLARAALRHALAVDDPELVDRLAAAAVALDIPLQGRAPAIEVAMIDRAYAATAALVRHGAPVPPDVLRLVNGAVPAELTAALLAAGAEPEIQAIVDCVAVGAYDSARLIAAASADRGVDVPAAYAVLSRGSLTELEEALSLVLDPTAGYGHYLGAAGLSERIERLRSFRLTP